MTIKKRVYEKVIADGAACTAAFVHAQINDVTVGLETVRSSLWSLVDDGKLVAMKSKDGKPCFGEQAALFPDGVVPYARRSHMKGEITEGVVRIEIEIEPGFPRAITIERAREIYAQLGKIFKVGP